jgi:hypothetical protein
MYYVRYYTGSLWDALRAPDGEIKRFSLAEAQATARRVTAWTDLPAEAKRCRYS